MLLFANNARTLLRSAITAASPTLLVEIGTGSLFPSPTDGDTFLATLQDSAGRIEVVEISGRSGDQLTVHQRGLDGTSAKTFEPGTVLSMRVTAELLRRVSADALRGMPDGVAPLDDAQRIPQDYLPLEAVTFTAGDERYVRLSELNKANQPPRLTDQGILPVSVIPSQYLTSDQGEGRYVRQSTLGQPGSPPALDANGKLTFATLPFEQGLLSSRAPLESPQFTGDAVFAGKITTIGAVQFPTARVTDLLTTQALRVLGEANFDGGMRVRDGATRGRLTVSTSAPTGVPADGDEWYQLAGA